MMIIIMTAMAFVLVVMWSRDDGDNGDNVDNGDDEEDSYLFMEEQCTGVVYCFMCTLFCVCMVKKSL